MKNPIRLGICRWFGGMLMAAAVGLTGCQTTDQADTGDLASVAVPGHTETEIQRAAAEVFLQHGYQPADAMTFEKQGTGWDTAAYGGWSGGAVWIRMRIHIASPKAGRCVLGCNAYMVTDRHSATMEQEVKLSHSRRSECKQILDEVKARLDSPPKTGAQ